MTTTYAGNEYGVCWALNPKTHVLSLSRKGPLPDFDPFSGRIPSWTVLREQTREIRLEDGITRIGNYSFYPYDHGAYANFRSTLRRITFPSSLESIGDWAFRANTCLDSIDLSGLHELRSIGDYAFASCYKAKAIDLSGCIQLSHISSNAFEDCDNLSYIDLSGCFALSYGALCSLRKAIPGHIPIIMPTGKISIDERFLASCEKERRAPLEETWPKDISIPKKSAYFSSS